VDVVVKGRHCEVTDRFRRHVEDKLTRLERFTARVIRIEVEVSKEHNRRLADRSERVELTVYSRGPIVRAEAASDDRHAALDMAIDKLLARLRKAADRRRVHHGTRTPISVAQATAAVAESNGNGSSSAAAPETEEHEAAETSTMAGIEVVGDGPLVVREKVHDAAPMALDQALYEMELVGHDFFLFIDAHSHRPSVVYRRRGYDYGVIALDAAAHVPGIPVQAAGT
jgi:ribosomal subunit interface protein